MDGSAHVRTAAVNDRRVAVFRIELDEHRPERLVTRDELGRAAFVSTDGGRSWRRVAGEE